jgi:hypothetical protein
VLKAQGLVIAVTGQMFLPEVLTRMAEHLTYGWTYSQPMPPPGRQSRIMGRHLFQTWKPWIVYSNGTWPSGSIDWHEDATPPSTEPSKAFRWQQPGTPVVYLLEKLTSPGALIVDPFAGVGTYGCVAVTMGRSFIGVEVDAKRFKVAARALRSNRDPEM